MSYVTFVENSKTAVYIRNCIISYPHLFEARRVAERGDPKFSAAFILPEDLTEADWAVLNGAVTAAIENKWGGKPPANLQMPWKNGTDADPQFEGRFMISASAKADSKPTVVQEKPTLPAQPGDVYPGMGVSAYLNAFAYDVTTNRGVSWGLNAVQITDRTLPRLDGRKDAAQVFEAVEVKGGPAPVSPTPAPGTASVAPGRPTGNGGDAKPGPGPMNWMG